MMTKVGRVGGKHGKHGTVLLCLQSSQTHFPAAFSKSYFYIIGSLDNVILSEFLRIESVCFFLAFPSSICVFLCFHHIMFKYFFCLIVFPFLPLYQSKKNLTQFPKESERVKYIDNFKRMIHFCAANFISHTMPLLLSFPKPLTWKYAFTLSNIGMHVLFESHVLFTFSPIY